jgi:gas vesicle protein
MQYRDEDNPNGLSNCIIALNMANRMGADPLMVMQNLYLIEGRPAWSSQFIMAAINSCGRFSALRFELEDLGEKEVEYQETSWVNGRKQNSIKKITVKNLTCVAWAIERETGERIESSKITMEMAVKEGWYGKNGSKWQTMPEQMLRYRAASFFGRVYAPELLMGLRSAEEEQDKIIDVTPEKDVSPKDNIIQIRNDILRAKSPADLDDAESKALMISDDVKREELLKMISAQAKKFKSVVSDFENDQNSTSNDVEKSLKLSKKRHQLRRLRRLSNQKNHHLLRYVKSTYSK